MSEKGAEEFRKALRLLPAALRLAAAELPESEAARTEELRLRAGSPISAVIGGEERVVAPRVYITPAELQMVLEIATRSSVHTYGESIRQGFVTAEGGCRLGLCGAAVSENGKIAAMRRLSSVCIRIPHEKQGCADGVLPQLTEGGFKSANLLSEYTDTPGLALHPAAAIWGAGTPVGFDSLAAGRGKDNAIARADTLYG